MKRKFRLSVVAVYLGLMSVCAANASPFSIKMVADNDFAIFGGTATGINDLLYQNNVWWGTQISTLSTLTFTLPAADTMFYVLGMGGGGNENISGLINGVDMTSASVKMSSDVQSFLIGYDLSAVSNGTFNANLSDVQAAFSQLTWGAPVLNTTDEVIVAAAPNVIGFHFASDTAHLFEFSSTDVGVNPTPGTVPEPSSIALALIGLASLMRVRRSPRKTTGLGEEPTATFA